MVFMIDEAGSGAPTARAEAALGWTVSLEQWEMERPLKAPSVSVTFGPITPILRIFDIAKARAFYLDYLGCAVWQRHDLPDPGGTIILTPPAD